MPRFVILHHKMPPGHERGSHFDLMFEVGSVLRTWSLSELPAADKVIQAEALPDHRLAYLEYEGIVSGNRGAVCRVEEGEYAIVREVDGFLQYRLKGRLLTGLLSLRTDNQVPACWTAEFSSG